MKRVLMTIALLGMTATAWAQASSMTQAQPGGAYDGTRIFVGATGGVTFGNTTSSTFGAELGFKFGDAYELFIEGGRMTDVTTSATENAAADIGGFLATLGQGTPTWTVKTPANYGAIGLRYLFPPKGRFQPYLALSLGGANVEKQTTFALNGNDVTGSLPSLGVQLGEDLAGRTNNFLVTVGGGLRVPFGRVQADLGVRYGRIFTDPGTDTFRLYAGVGYRF